MEPDLQPSILSAHVRYRSRDSVIGALLRLGIGRGAAIPVWPPKALPYGLVLSPVRNGWVSIWSPLDNTRDWFPQLVGTLECPGVILEAIQGDFWVLELLQDGDFRGRWELPTEAAEYDDLWARTVESLEAEGCEQPWEDEIRFGARLDEIARSRDYQEDLEHVREERPDPEDLEPFLPPHASIERAWELLTAIDHVDQDEEAAEADHDAADYLERFASYLGIQDAAWDFRADLDALAAGEFEDEEGLPENWREFAVLPLSQLPVL